MPQLCRECQTNRNIRCVQVYHECELDSLKLTLDLDTEKDLNALVIVAVEASMIATYRKHLASKAGRDRVLLLRIEQDKQTPEVVFEVLRRMCVHFEFPA